MLCIMTVLTAVKCRVPTVTHVIPSQDRDSVTAVTSLDDDVFVVRCDSQRVEVYDAVTFTLQRHITVQGLGSQTYGIIQYVPEIDVCICLTSTTTAYTE